MKREVLLQLILLGIALVAMVLGIVFTRPMEAVHDKTLLDILTVSSASPAEDSTPSDEAAPEDAPVPAEDAEAETRY